MFILGTVHFGGHPAVSKYSKNTWIHEPNITLESAFWVWVFWGWTPPTFFADLTLWTFLACPDYPDILSWLSRKLVPMSRKTMKRSRCPEFAFQSSGLLSKFVFLTWVFPFLIVLTGMVKYVWCTIHRIKKLDLNSNTVL